MMIGVRKVFEFAVEEFVCFQYREIHLASRDINVAVRRIKEKFWGVCFAPCGVGIWVGGDGWFEPKLERTVCPGVLRGLQADESGAEAEGVGEAKG